MIDRCKMKKCVKVTTTEKSHLIRHYFRDHTRTAIILLAESLGIPNPRSEGRYALINEIIRKTVVLQ